MDDPEAFKDVISEVRYIGRLPAGSHFIVTNWPKSGKNRRFAVDERLVAVVEGVTICGREAELFVGRSVVGSWAAEGLEGAN